MFNFCPPFCLSELKVGAVNHINFTVLHSISLFCTDLGLIDVLLTNQNAEIVACILLTAGKNKHVISRLRVGPYGAASDSIFKPSVKWRL